MFYTPTPIVRYMISSVDEILIKFFNKNKGLMDDSVYLLDPCAGTATFVIEAIKQIYGKLDNTGNLGLFKGIRKIHYRPFDFQYVFYMDGFVQITCRERAEHLKGNSSGELALIIGRSGRPSKYSWDMVIMTSEMPDQVLVTYRGSSILCPMNYKKSTDTKTLSSNIRTRFLLNLKNYYLRENSVSHIDNAEFPRNVM
ncbi:unnamed protein product, partial [marine sediment metagenome]